MKFSKRMEPTTNNIRAYIIEFRHIRPIGILQTISPFAEMVINGSSRDTLHW